MTATRGEAIITTATPAAGTAALHSATYIHAAQQAWHFKGNVMISGKNIDRRTVLKAGVAALGSSLSGISWAQGADDTLTMGVISQQTGTFAYAGDLRSEEHTSALQSLMRISYAVFCLKKKTLPPESPTTF